MARLKVSIEYCTVCNFRGRAAWLAQELLAEHEADLAELTLVPGRGGVLDVRVDGDLVFSNRRAGRFPEPRELKDAIRARLRMPPAPRTIRSSADHSSLQPNRFRPGRP